MKKQLLFLFLPLIASIQFKAQVGEALNFDGSNDKIVISNSINSILDPLNTITVEAWVNPTNTVFNGVIAGNYLAPSNTMQFLLRRDGDSYAFWVDDGSGYKVATSGASSVVLNTWQHVAGVWDGSSLYIYINGVLMGTTTGVTGSSFASTSNNVVIGSNSYPESFEGSIDEVRIWSSARTQCDIISYKNCEIPGSATGLLVNYHFNQGIVAVNNSAVNTLTDASGNSNDGALTSFALNGTFSNWISPGGVTTGITAPSTCTLAAALDFDGTNDFVTIPSGINIANRSFTIEFWAKRNGTGSGDFLFGQQSSQTTNNSLHIGFRDNDAFTFAFYGNDLDVNHPATTDGNMHHWACVYNSGQSGIDRFIYLDGVLIASDNASGDFSGSGPLYIGNNFFSGDFFNGTMDEVRIWNVARTQCQINTYMSSEIPSSLSGLVSNYHFNQGVIPNSNSTVNMLNDASGNSNNGSLNNFALTGSSSNWVAPGAVVSNFSTTSISTFCLPAEALNLDGIDDYVDLGTPTNLPVGNSAYTIEAKIKPNVIGAKGIVGWGNYNYGTIGESNALRLDPSGSIVNYWWYQDLVVSPAPINLLDGNWHHIAATFDGTIRSIYVDGILKGSDTPSPSPNVPAMNVRIGSTCATCSGEFFDGGIDEVRIWNVGRTQCDVISYMNCEIPTTAAGLVANYHFNQGIDGVGNATVTTVIDASGNSNNGIVTNLSLNSATSNWIAPGGVVSGSVIPAVCNLAAALNFDGSDDVVSLPNGLPSMTDITIEGWIYPESISNFNVILNNSSWATGYLHYQLSPSGQLGFAINGNVPTDQSTSMVFNPNQLYHIATVYSSSNQYVKFYVNGVLVDTYFYTTALATAANMPFEIGGWDNQRFFDGTMDELRIWNTIRTECEINTYMNCEIPTTAAGLVANYHFNQGVDAFNNSIMTTVMDASGNSNNGSLNNFALNGSTSNWVAPGAVVNGYTTALSPPTISVTSGAICTGQSFTMVPSGATTYTFSSGTDIVMPTSDATYSVSGTDANGCVSSTDAISSITVNALPVMVSQSGDVTVCGDATGTFSLIASNTDSYLWQYSINSGTPNIIIGSYAETGYTTAVMQIPTLESQGWDGYDIECILTSVDGCTLISTPKLITVNPLPIISVNSGTICAGQSFTMVPSGSYAYAYSGGSDVVMPTNDATYTVTGTNTLTTCSAIVESTVTVNALPMLTATTSNTLLCTGQTATLSVSGATSYTWSTSETTANIAVTPTVQTTYLVEGLGANGCFNSTTITQDVSLCTGIASLIATETMINVYPNPNKGLFIIELNGTSQVSISNTLGQVIMFDKLDSGKHNLDIQNQSTGIYFVKVILEGKQYIIKLIKE